MDRQMINTFSSASDSPLGQTSSGAHMQQLFSTGNSFPLRNIAVSVTDQLELDSLGETLRLPSSDISTNNCYDSGSGTSGYGSPTSSLLSYGSNTSFSTTVTATKPTIHPQPSCRLIQTRTSSHLLQNKISIGIPHPFSNLFSELIDSETGPLRRVCSKGDLHWMPYSHRSDSPLRRQSTGIIIEDMHRAYRYDPEEKKQRIERYRSKRSLRNFNREIKYNCRKTLADSRPRIRGRFARNDGIDEMKAPVEWRRANGEDEVDWMTLLDTFSGNTVQ